MPPLKTILMCRPTFFQVRYAINPWMNAKEPVNTARAQTQWDTLKARIEKAGAAVKVMEPAGADQFPDLVFTANAATIRGRTAYLANFFYPERQGERFFYGKWLSENGYRTVGSTEIPFEGTGDALWCGPDRSTLICGIGPRTDVRALKAVSDTLSPENAPFKTYGVRLVDPRFYHIDTCFCPLTEELALFYPHAFDPVSRYNISNEVKELVTVSEEDACRFACNAVVVGKTVIMHQGAEQTARDLERVGFQVDFVDMSEFLKSGGSAKCCTLEIA